jgi:hypothetical protein
MGLKSFWSLILLFVVAAGLLHWGRASGSAPRQLVPNDPHGTVLIEPVEAPAPPIQPKALPIPAASPDHTAKVQFKIPTPPRADGGVVEREEKPRLLRMKDGSLIIDNYWTILSGDGSAENPYRLTWDLLLSAQSEFDPAAPQLPDRLKWLDGKFVVLKGYTLQSITNGATGEFLLNDQLMDNCPICTARSVFATASVKTKTPEKLDRGVINVFTVRGQFKAQPVVRAGFLLGVYFLEDAEIISRTN